MLLMRTKQKEHPATSTHNTIIATRSPFVGHTSLHIAVLTVGILNLLLGFARRPADQRPRTRLQFGLAARLRQQVGPRLLRAQRRTVHASFAYASNEHICCVAGNLSNAPPITFTRCTHVRRRSALQAAARHLVCRTVRTVRTARAADAATCWHDARQLQQRFEQQTDVMIGFRRALEHFGPHLGQFAVQPLGHILQHDFAMRCGQIGLVAGDHDGNFLRSNQSVIEHNYSMTNRRENLPDSRVDSPVSRSCTV